MRTLNKIAVNCFLVITLLLFPMFCRADGWEEAGKIFVFTAGFHLISTVLSVILTRISQKADGYYRRLGRFFASVFIILILGELLALMQLIGEMTIVELVIMLLLITFFIYFLYLNLRRKHYTNNHPPGNAHKYYKLSVVLVFILIINIWVYGMTEGVESIMQRHGIKPPDFTLLFIYLILLLITGLSIARNSAETGHPVIYSILIYLFAGILIIQNIKFFANVIVLKKFKEPELLDFWFRISYCWFPLACCGFHLALTIKKDFSLWHQTSNKS